MTPPSLHVSAVPAREIQADVLVVGVVKGADGPRVEGPLAEELGALGAGLASLGLTGAADEVSRQVAPAGLAAGSVLLVGLGSGPATPDSLRSAAGTAARSVSGASRLAIALPTADGADVQAVLEGAALGAYRYTAYRSGDAPAPVAEIVLATDVDGADAALERARIVSEAVVAVRDLVNAPPNDLYPESFAARARELSEGLPVELQEWDVPALQEGGFGGILGVGQGSSRPPRLVAVRYAPEGATQHLALVGKGITFDSGGLSLKPAAAMVGMKYDMTGAATVLATALAVARLGLPIRVTAWLCLAENLPSSTAMRPNDVLTIRGGTTVEVLNTDAEGRLVLADGLVAASEERPDAIVDVATLTGAARVALGDRYAAVMGADDLVRSVQEAAAATGELVWPMPLPADLRSILQSEVADIANAKPGNTAAGMLLAGVFLQEFVGRTGDDQDAPRIPWAHLDIAGPASNGGSGYGWTPKGPSGVTVRLLVKLAERLAGQ
ncbi:MULTISPECIES: leucyl aminopeptidase [unclassified Microcella]|uniref:leucyl aminopeptidase n=1 Tax=unclassified Microcella TaxID=2630066 RepID=UPI0006FC662F|nr:MULTISPECIES: leucyl aminopeptidase [unclassified Microcella]KQV24937.1 aminopeptidase [Yonghaparkia sp. Root332]KRF31222.1 aminopeptidase [Yonghaparkia sp. Soil809]